MDDARIISRHVLRAVRGPLLIMSGGLVAAGIGIQAGLEYLGMGNPTDPTPKLVVDKLSEAALDPRNHRYTPAGPVT